MRTIHYKRDTMIGQFIGCMVFAAASAYMAFIFDGELMLFFGFLALGLPVVAIALARRAMGDCVALRFDRETLHVVTLFGRATLAWSQVRDLHRETLTQSHAFGLIKKQVGSYLVIVAADGDMSERKFKLSEDLLDLPRGAIPALIDDLASAWAGMARPTRDAAPVDPDRTRPQPRESVAAETGFDADAVMARYLAKQRGADAGTPGANLPARRTFGRRIS